MKDESLHEAFQHRIKLLEQCKRELSDDIVMFFKAFYRSLTGSNTPTSKREK